MSGFETAAGTFAVVGVADVLIRSSRDIWNFLRDIADAPDELQRLCEFIQETSILYQTSEQCRKNLATQCSSSHNAGAAITSLRSATGALERGLQTLKNLVSRYKGVKNWKNIRIVFGEDRVKKALQTLEHAKALLANALMLTCIELSLLGDSRTEAVVRQCFQQAGLQADDVSHALAAKLDAQHKDVFTMHSQYEQGLITLNDNQRNLLADHEKQQKTLLSIQCRQVDGLNHQDALLRVATSIQEQTTTILQKVELASAKTFDASTRTTSRLEEIAAGVKLLLSPNSGSMIVKQSDRKIHFLGERQDRILVYLLPLQDEFDYAINHLISQYGDDISASHAKWLCSEIENLVASATQEKASQCINSTAKSFDQWSYPEDTVGFLKNTTKKRKASTSTYIYNADEQETEESSVCPRKRSKKANRAWSVSSPSGDICITLPRSQTKRTVSQNTEEVGFAYVSRRDGLSFAVRAHFLRDLAHASRPSIYAQLNIFIEAGYAEYDMCYALFNNANLAEIDSAFREGKISPYHLTKGNNICLYIATRSRRLDILNYLESQGIGQSALNHDSSIVPAYCYSVRRSRWDFIYDPELFLEDVSSRAADLSAFVLDVALELLLYGYSGNIQTNWRLLDICFKIVRRNRLDLEQNDWRQLPGSSWSCVSVPELLRILIDAGASTEKKTQEGMNVLSRFLYRNPGGGYDSHTITDVLSILVEKGVEISNTCSNGLTPSMCARLWHFWEEWCEALERNNKKIEDVLHVEDNAWLSKSDWRQRWTDNGFYLWHYIYGDEEIGDQEDKSSDCSGKSDPEDHEHEVTEVDRGITKDLPGQDDADPDHSDTSAESSVKASHYSSTEHIKGLISSKIVSMHAHIDQEI